jgi:peptidoglycan/xylan/chitin deacetylase (PgdA/CDA1 family)
MTATPIPILMYHSISTRASRRFRPFAVSPERFEAHVRAICAGGRSAITVSTLVEAMQQPGARLPDNPVVLTFDDGFADFLHAALPVLSAYRLPATLYVVTGFSGSTSRWLAKAGEGDRPLLSWTELAEVNRRGIEIGAHSVTHAALDMIPLREARDEIRNSKLTIEDRLGIAVASFAYPYGFYSAPVRALVEEEGYSSACAVRYAASSIDDDRFALARHIVPHDAGADAIAALLDDRPAILPLMRNRARSAVGRLVRQSFYGIKP